MSRSYPRRRSEYLVFDACPDYYLGHFRRHWRLFYTREQADVLREIIDGEFEFEDVSSGRRLDYTSLRARIGAIISANDGVSLRRKSTKERRALGRPRKCRPRYTSIELLFKVEKTTIPESHNEVHKAPDEEDKV